MLYFTEKDVSNVISTVEMLSPGAPLTMGMSNTLLNNTATLIMPGAKGKSPKILKFCKLWLGKKFIILG